MKTYKVWLCIEEYDDETGEGNDVDAPGASLAQFDTPEEAWEFAQSITAAHTGQRDTAVYAGLRQQDSKVPRLAEGQTHAWPSESPGRTCE